MKKVDFEDIRYYYSSHDPKLPPNSDQYYIKLRLTRILSKYLKETYNVTYPINMEALGKDKYKSQLKKLVEIRKQDLQIIKIADDISSTDILASMMTETILGLKRGIYYFLNYRYNIRQGWEIAAILPKYYSEFFLTVAIGRYMGQSLSYLNEPFKRTRIDVDWSKKIVKLHTRIGSGNGGHNLQFNASAKWSLSYLTEKAKNIYGRVIGGNSMLFKNERERDFYEMKEIGADVFDIMWYDVDKRVSELKRWSTLSFIAGRLSIPTSTAEESEHIEDMIANGGYEEAYIGTLMRFLLNEIKEIAKLNDKYLEVLNHLKIAIKTTEKLGLKDDMGKQKLIEMIDEYLK